METRLRKASSSVTWPKGYRLPLDRVLRVLASFVPVIYEAVRATRVMWDTCRCCAQPVLLTPTLSSPDIN